MVNKPSMDKGFSLALNLAISTSRACALAALAPSLTRVAIPATRGITIYKTTESSNVVHGTSMSVIPSKKATIGAKAKIMITSFNATWTSV